jgi:hypothetical protein
MQQLTATAMGCIVLPAAAQHMPVLRLEMLLGKLLLLLIKIVCYECDIQPWEITFLCRHGTARHCRAK